MKCHIIIFAIVTHTCTTCMRINSIWRDDDAETGQHIYDQLFAHLQNQLYEKFKSFSIRSGDWDDHGGQECLLDYNEDIDTSSTDDINGLRRQVYEYGVLTGVSRDRVDEFLQEVSLDCENECRNNVEKRCGDCDTREINMMQRLCSTQVKCSKHTEGLKTLLMRMEKLLNN